MKKFDDQIEDYILGTLTKNEKVDFESELISNKDLQKSVNEHKLLISNLERLRIKNKVDKIIKTNNLNNNLGIFLRIAAMLIFLFSVFILLKPEKIADPVVLKDKPLSNDTATNINLEKLQLEEENKNLNQSPVADSDPKPKIDALKLLELVSKFIAFTEFSGLRSENDSEINNAFEKIKKNLASHKYSEALNDLNSIEPLHQSEYVMMLKADCLFQLKRYNESSIMYSKLGSSFQYKYDAEWNLMLCHLIMNQQHMFEISLKAILKNKDHPYYEKAIELNKKSKEL